MRPCLVLLSALLLIAAVPLGEPTRDAVDDELIRLASEGNHEALTAEQRARLPFWEWYYVHRAQLQKLQDGALFKDDFNAPELSEISSSTDAAHAAVHPDQSGNWRVWNTDGNLSVELENGMLAIRGRTSDPAPPLNFNGLEGKTLGETDVVLVVDMRSVSPHEQLPGTHLAMAHLCGSFPDLFNELGFGRSGNDLVGWSHHQVAGTAPGLRALEGRPPFGDEHDRFTTLRLEHDATTELSRAWALRGNAWVEIGRARAVVMSTAKVELKVKVPTSDVDVECYFDNCRLYGRPETHPARFLVFKSDVGETDVEGVTVDLFLEDGDSPTVSGVTVASGWASLTLPSDRTYPVAARVRYTLTTGETWERTIERDELSGLYPGDVWVAHLNALDISGDDRWWQRMRTKSLLRASEASARDR